MATEGESGGGKGVNLTFWLVLGAVALGGWYMIEKQQVASGQLAATDISNPIGKVVRFVNDKTTSVRGSTLGKIPVVSTVDDYAGRAMSRPVSNVTSGNTSAVVWSAATGGLSDLTSWRPW